VKRRRLAAAVVLALVGVAGIVVGLLAMRGDGGGDDAGAGALEAVLAGATAARPPFAGLTEVRLAVGERCLSAVVADTEAERERGLRQRSDIGPYDAMLFVFDRSVDVDFTMSTVPVALDIGFYDASGRRVAERHMLPCPKVESECPVYAAGAAFRYALETLGGRLPSGPIGACPG
jgi:uncharacterized membrane protein (UPF0127 family)